MNNEQKADLLPSSSLEQNGVLADAVQEGNKFIAHFMDEYDLFHWGRDPFNEFCKADYHYRWDNLIPAWAKFCDKSLEFLPSLKNKVGFEKEVKFYVVQKGKFEKAVHSNNCSQAFEILVESIKWYNAENNKSA